MTENEQYLIRVIRPLVLNVQGSFHPSPVPMLPRLARRQPLRLCDFANIDKSFLIDRSRRSSSNGKLAEETQQGKQRGDGDRDGDGDFPVIIPDRIIPSREMILPPLPHSPVCHCPLCDGCTHSPANDCSERTERVETRQNEGTDVEEVEVRRERERETRLGSPFSSHANATTGHEDISLLADENQFVDTPSFSPLVRISYPTSHPLSTVPSSSIHSPIELISPILPVQSILPSSVPPSSTPSTIPPSIPPSSTPSSPSIPPSSSVPSSTIPSSTVPPSSVPPSSVPSSSTHYPPLFLQSILEMSHTSFLLVQLLQEHSDLLGMRRMNDFSNFIALTGYPSINKCEMEEKKRNASHAKNSSNMERSEEDSEAEEE